MHYDWGLVDWQTNVKFWPMKEQIANKGFTLEMSSTEGDKQNIKNGHSYLLHFGHYDVIKKWCM